MANEYPFDAPTREHVARLLYRALPLLYRVQDQPPNGRDDLRNFLRILAAPLALLRQSIDELHANVFIDTCGNAALPLLAQLVGTDLVFPDADTNRRDLRGTVSRRRRKGTRPMLEELGRELTEQLTVLTEGWERLVVVQALNTPRSLRTVADLRPITFGSSASGPLDVAHHLVDIRAITPSTGRYHPSHLTYWVHLTRTFPLQRGTACYLPALPGDPDPVAPTAERREWRFAFHPAGNNWALRQRPTHDDDVVYSDRILPEHFARRPADFFGVDGRFVVRVAELPAAVARSSTEQRSASAIEADVAVAEGEVTIELLDRPLRGWNGGSFELALCLVERIGTPQTHIPASVSVRSTIALGAGSSVPVDTGPINPTWVIMVRLVALTGSGGFFPGATVAITGGLPSGARAHSTLGAQGFLRGSLAVRLPAMWAINGPRWLYLAADGSVYDSQTLGTALSDITFLDPAYLRAAGPGAAWPPLERQSGDTKLTTVPPAAGHGPNVLHGGWVLDAVTQTEISGSTQCMLVFAARFFDAGFDHELVGRLRWAGPDPSDASWELLDNGGQVVADAEVAVRLQQLVEFRNAGPNQLVLAVRFECDADAIFTPAEVIWPDSDGGGVLIYLGELGELAAPNPSDNFTTSQPFVSAIVQAYRDGSTRATNGVLLRVAEGQVAPLRGPVLHLRRRVRWRDLTEPPTIPPDLGSLALAERCLDVDVKLGRFSLNGEAPQPWPPGPTSVPPPGFLAPPNVTVAFEDAYTGHVGARPAPREIILLQELEIPRRSPQPTRLVSRSGTHHTSLDASLYAVPLYPSVSDALAAIAAAPSTAELDSGAVIQIEDDSTYPGQTLAWPEGIESLTLRAADSRRPLLGLAASPAPLHSYRTLTLLGLAFGGAPLVLPECTESIDIQFCTVTDSITTLTLPLTAGSRCSIVRSITSSLEVLGSGVLEITDSVVDAGANDPPPLALQALDATAKLERSTFVGTVGLDGQGVRQLHASHCLFTDPVYVIDRFHGCVRFCGVSPGSVLPRRHEVFEIPASVGPRLLSLNRHDPSHARLSDQSPSELRGGGEDGSELGAFNELQTTQRLSAFERRLSESTPAGLVWKLLRVN